MKKKFFFLIEFENGENANKMEKVDARLRKGGKKKTKKTLKKIKQNKNIHRESPPIIDFNT